MFKPTDTRERRDEESSFAVYKDRLNFLRRIETANDDLPALDTDCVIEPDKSPLVSTDDK